MERLIKSVRREDGQALVELAFVLPMLLLLVFAIIDFGLAFSQYSGDANIANMAAREVAVIGSTTSETCNGTAYTTLTTWVDCEAAATGAPTPSSVCVADTAGSTPSGTYTVGDPVKVEITSSFNWLSILSAGDSYISKVGNLSSHLSASASMRLEQAPGSNTFLTPTCTS